MKNDGMDMSQQRSSRTNDNPLVNKNEATKQRRVQM
jgi:hypothetical protein